jgi:glycosyltransferase involved in cell wall biosynthesis
VTVGGRVLLVHYHFPPDGLAGSQITAKFGKHLPQFGWEPWVLTASERYYPRVDPTTIADVTRWDRVVRTPRIPHPRYAYLALKRLLGLAAGGGGGPTPGASPEPARRPRVIRAVRDLLMTPDDVLGWAPPAVVAGVRMVRTAGIDRVFSSGPPWTNHLVAAALRRLTGVPWAACFEDPWAETAAADGDPLAARAHARLEAAVVRAADAVIALNDHHRRALAARFRDLGGDRFVTISNGWDRDDFPPPSAPPPAPPFTITLTGTIYPRQTPRHFFAAVRRVLDAGVVREAELRVRLVGNCAMAEGRSVERMADEHGLARVVSVAPFVPRRDAMELLQASHLLLVLAHEYVLQIPSKTYQYLRVGRPVLALAPDGATAEFVRASGAGAVVDPYDVDGIAAALAGEVRRVLAGERRAGADPAFVAAFDRRRLTGRLARLLDALDGRVAARAAPPIPSARSA